MKYKNQIWVTIGPISVSLHLILLKSSMASLRDKCIENELSYAEIKALGLSASTCTFLPALNVYV